MLKGLTGFLMVLLFVVCLPMGINAETVSKVVAVVNGVSLFEPDLNQEIGSIMPMNQSFHGKLSEQKMVKIRSDAMKNLIDFELGAQDARHNGIKIPQAVIDEEMNRLAIRFKSKDELASAYKNAGFTQKSFLHMMERRLLAEKILFAEVDANVSVSSEKVKNHYNANVSRYSKPEEFRASHVLIKVEPSSTQEQRSVLRAKADTLLKRIKDGERFEEIALNESDDLSKIKGGDVGYFHAGQTVAEFEEALVTLKVGETSTVVETLYGYHIIRLTDRRPARQIPFDEIQDKIKNDLVASEKKQLLEDWMGRLYKKAKITYPGEK